MKYLPQIKADNAAADKAAASTKKTRPRPKRSRKPAREVEQSKGAAVPAVADASHEPAAPADTLPRVHINRGEGPYYGGNDWPEEPPPSLIPPEVQAELDRFIRENRALKAAMRALLGEE